jgi:hypothetical protein
MASMWSVQARPSMTLHPPENFPEDGTVIASRLEVNFNGFLKLEMQIYSKIQKNTTINNTMQK